MTSLYFLYDLKARVNNKAILKKNIGHLRIWTSVYDFGVLHSNAWIRKKIEEKMELLWTRYTENGVSRFLFQEQNQYIFALKGNVM